MKCNLFASSDLLEPRPMETIGERRRRKLISLVKAAGGGARALEKIASITGLSPASLDQVIKGTLLPPKKDGTRSPKSLGDPSARAIEEALELGHGWFDSDDTQEASIEPTAVDVLQSALVLISKAVSQTDKWTRLAVEPLLSELLANPSESVNIARRIAEMLASSGSLQEASDHQGRTANQVVNFDVEKSSDGTSDSVEEKGHQAGRGRRTRSTPGKG